MSKREKMIGIILALVVVTWVKMYIFKPHKEEISVPSVKSIPVQLPQKVSQPKETEALTLDDILARGMIKKAIQKTEATNNPFQKFNQTKKYKGRVLKFSDLVLSGIMVEDNEPIALINDEVLKKGDSIAGFKVEEIKPNEVLITQGSEKHILRLFATAENK